ncbi:pentatricopeptide repeat-containing protein at5g39350-like protein, partial [Trifolium pratense]
VDLLGRAGRLNDAYNLIITMPIAHNHAVWGALLGACVIHENVELGEVAARWTFELEPENTGNYVLLSKLYSSVGRWRDAENVRDMVNEVGLRKLPARSLVEVSNMNFLHRGSSEGISFFTMCMLLGISIRRLSSIEISGSYLGCRWTGAYVMGFGDLIKLPQVQVGNQEEARFSFLQGGYVEDFENQAARRIVEADEFKRAGLYDGWLPHLFVGNLLKGQTVGVIGAGRIGSGVCKNDVVTKNLLVSKYLA